MIARAPPSSTNYIVQFGLGSRTCIGRHISTLEMSKLVPEIVKSFDLKLGMPKEEWKTINYWFVKPEKFPVTVECRDTSS
jgi:cytochrome P450